LARTKLHLEGPTWVGILAVALAVALPAAAVEDEVHIEYRQKVMSGVGADMGAISDILKHGLPYTAAIALHASRMGDAAALVPTAFGVKVTEGLTDAKPEIWAKPDEFEQATKNFADAAADLEAAAVGNDREAVKAAFKVLGKSCGGCHDTFRKPKEESYKRR